MSKNYRITLFVLSFSILLIIGFYIKKDLTFLLKDFWFSSGLLLLILLSLLDQPHFSKDANIFVNSITAALSLLLVEPKDRDWVFWLFVSFSLYLAISSYVLLWIRDESLKEENVVVQFASRFNREIGKPATIFSSFFLWGASKQFSLNSNEFNLLLWFWVIFNILNIPQLAKAIELLLNYRKKEAVDHQIIGELFGVQSKKVFLVKIYNKRSLHIRRFDIVRIRYSMLDYEDLVIVGIVFDTYLLNQEKWAKILQISNPKKEESDLGKNIAYKITDDRELKKISKELNLDNFVGIVIEDSSISRIKFEYSKKLDDLQEGDLLELKISQKKLFYQVVAGITAKEKLEDRNETGFIEGEAVQLGEWIGEDACFRKYGWVPSINTSLFKADTSKIEIPKFNYPDFNLGVIPGTTLPSILNLHEAISHHIALIGITGSGKSFISRVLVQELLRDSAVICVDFTGEWKKTMEKGLVRLLEKKDIESFLSRVQTKMGILELHSISNTTEVLQETQVCIEKIFNFAKEQYDKNPEKMKRIVLVLEEAHTIVPESNFLGENGSYGSNKALVNKMTQVALQGRKYGVGLMVIAQRTANVSKTVLTQCNSVICFQAFDESSFAFLGNYVGKDMISALPNLKQYHAIVSGMAFRSSLPMIVDLTRKKPVAKPVPRKKVPPRSR